jgi:hypothetical protein
VEANQFSKSRPWQTLGQPDSAAITKPGCAAAQIWLRF